MTERVQAWFHQITTLVDWGTAPVEAGIIARGLVVGLAGSLALLHLTRSLLFGIQPADPMVIGASTAVFIVAAAIAGGLPARLAAAIDPVIALRHE